LVKLQEIIRIYSDTVPVSPFFDWHTLRSTNRSGQCASGVIGTGYPQRFIEFSLFLTIELLTGANSVYIQKTSSTTIVFKKVALNIFLKALSEKLYIINR
jgi:hypothetical protein